MVVSPDEKRPGLTGLEITNGLLNTERLTVSLVRNGSTSLDYPDSFYQTENQATIEVTQFENSGSGGAVWGIAVVEDDVDVNGDYDVVGETRSWTELGSLGSEITGVGDQFTIPLPDDGGTYRLSITAGSSSAVSQDINNGSYGATDPEFHFDADGNGDSGGTAPFNQIASSAIGHLGRSIVVTVADDDGTDPYVYPDSPTHSVSIRSALDGTTGVQHPKTIEVGLRQNGTSTYSKTREPTPNTTGDATTTSTNIDTDFPVELTEHDVVVGLNGSVVGGGTPAGQQAGFFSLPGLLFGFSTDERSWVHVADGGHGVGLTQEDGSGADVENDRRVSALQAFQAGSKIEVYEDAGGVTPGVDAFEDSGYTTQRDIFRRKLPSSSVGSLAQAVPRLQTFVLDAAGDPISSTSFVATSRRQTDDGAENTQTLTSGSGGTAGRLRWNYTVQPTYPAFNRFIKSGGTRVANSHVASGPDDPENAPFYFQSGTVDTIRASNIAPGDRILINDPDAFNIGDRITVDQGGANEDTYIVDDIDYLDEELVLTAQTSISHTAGEAIIKNWPVYPRRVRVVGNAFGSKNPQDQHDDQFGLNSEIHFESIWTGDVPSATIDAQGAPTGKMSRTQSANTGDHRFKLCTAIDASTGFLRNATEHNPKMVDGTSIDVNDSPADDLEQRWAAWNATAQTLEQSPINSNVELSTDRGYSTSPTDGFEVLDTSGGSRNLDLVIGAGDDATQSGTLDLTDTPITDTLWNPGETQSGEAGFTSDDGMFGYYSVRVSFFIIDPANKAIVATESATLPPGENIQINFKTVRFAPDLTHTPIKPDSAPLVIVAEEVPGGEINIVQQATATAVNPDVNGKSSNWEFNFAPPENGTYSFKVVWSFNGSLATEGPTVQVQSGTPDPRLRLVGDVGHARSSRNPDHARAGDIIEFGVNLADDAATDLVDMDATDPDGNPSPTVLILRGVGSGSEEFFDSDETWKPVSGNTLFRHPLTLAGDSRSARIEFQTDSSWGGSDIEAVFVAHRDGARYSDRVIREFVGNANPHGSNISLSVAAGNPDNPGRHIIPGEDVLIGAAIEDETDELAFDTMMVAIRRFRADLGTLEYWDGSAWQLVGPITGNDTFTYLPMTESPGNPKLAIFTLPASAVDDTGDLFIRVRATHTPVDTDTEVEVFGQTAATVTDRFFQHNKSDAISISIQNGSLSGVGGPWKPGDGFTAVADVFDEELTNDETLGTDPRVVPDDEDAELLDSSGQGHDLVAPVNEPVLVPFTKGPKFGDAFRFAGDGQDLVEHADADLAMDGDLSYTSVLMPATMAHDHGLIRAESDAGVHFGLRVLADGTLRYSHATASGTVTLDSASGLFTADTAHTITLTRDTATKTVIANVDGVEVINTTYATAVVAKTTNEKTTLGADPTAGTDHFEGDLANTRIWTSVVDQTTLDDIVDPTISEFGGGLVEGTEEAAWLIEGLKAFVFLIRAGTAATGPQYLHSDNTWRNVKDIGTGSEPSVLTTYRMSIGSTSRRLFFIWNDDGFFDSGFDTSSWSDTQDITTHAVIEVDGIQYSDSHTEEVDLQNVGISVAAGDVSDDGGHARVGQPLTFGAAVEDAEGKLPIDGPNTDLGTTADPDAFIALRRFNAGTGLLEEWDGASWNTVPAGQQPFTYLPMSRSPSDDDLALFTLAGGTNTTQDILYRVKMRSNGVLYTASGQLMVVGDQFIHSATDESSIPFDPVNGHHHTQSESSEGNNVDDSRAIGHRGMPP